MNGPSPSPFVPPPPAVRPVGGVPVAPPKSGPSRKGWRSWAPVRIWKRHFPPVRLVWIFLLVIVWNGHGFLSSSVALPLLALPAVAALTDLGLQMARYPRPRIPDAAVANGLFLSVILWPTTVSIEFAAVAAATVGLRHLLRRGGHPILNPAALGVTVAATVFALPQPWHVGVTTTDALLIALLGVVLWSRAWHTWRLWGVYFASTLLATAVLALALGGRSAVPLAVDAALVGPAPVFFGWFMVTEPRTAPSSRPAMIAFGALVGVGAAALPVVLALVPLFSPLGVLAPYLALFAGNVFAVAARAHRSARPAGARPTPAPRPT
jgi:hypothetical protein